MFNVLNLPVHKEFDRVPPEEGIAMIRAFNGKHLTAYGSAVLLDGFCLTSAHVLKSATRFELSWMIGEHGFHYGIDTGTPPVCYPNADLAVHRLLPRNECYYPTRNISDRLPKHSDWVTIVGHPMNRKVAVPPIIQEAQIVPSEISGRLAFMTSTTHVKFQNGLSGGAVFNSQGELLAIVTQGKEIGGDAHILYGSTLLHVKEDLRL